MRSSSASIRAALTILLFAAFYSCASAPPGTDTPRPVTIAGTLRVSGMHPYERQVVLEGEAGDYWLLRAPALEGELLQLDGQMVRAHGRANGGTSGARELSIDWYEVLAPPGRVAGVGTLGSRGEELVLYCDRGGEEAAAVELFIGGPLREPLDHFVGYRVWVNGERVDAGGGDGSGTVDAGSMETPAAGSERIEVVVIEYGVLGPPRIPLRAAPYSTYPDSCR